MLIARLLTFSAAITIGCCSIPAACEAQQTARDAIYQSALPLFQYDVTAPLDPSVIASGTYPECTWQKISFTASGRSLPGLLFLPVGASKSKPVPCLLLLHGLGGRKEQMIPVARFLGSIGYASWAIDDAGSGERASDPARTPNYATLSDLTNGTIQQSSETVIDLRRSMDYLSTRPEIEQRKIGLMGFSLGALIGGVLAGVDSRIQAAILVSGGGNLGEILTYEAHADVAFGKMYRQLLINSNPESLETALARIDPLNFVAHISPRPVQLEEGAQDKIIPPASAKLLYSAAEEPKTLEWYPNAGHIPPPLELYPSISIFLDRYLPLSGR